jgi:hydrogenase small subunit
MSRRNFVRICTVAAAAVGLPARAAAEMVRAITTGKKPSVIWLSLQECTGCTETLLRPTAPGLAELILDLISLDYHEALMAPSGHLAEETRKRAMEEHAGQFILVTEGATPTRDGGIYCKIGGRTALSVLTEAADMAGAIIAIGSCASFGGVPAAEPNPTGAMGTPQVLRGKPVVTIPGCPPNPYNFLGTVLQYATFGTLPELDALGRPKFAYGRTIHDDCPRRAHFDAGQFAEKFGDEGHRNGWCLYELGCKGPQTYGNCATQNFGEVVGAWPIGIGHPCVGCTEQSLAFRVALHETIEIERPTSPDAFPPIAAPQGSVSPWATGLAGLTVGGVAGAAYMASKKLEVVGGEADDEAEPPAESKGS